MAKPSLKMADCCLEFKRCGHPQCRQQIERQWVETIRPEVRRVLREFEKCLNAV